VKKHGFTAADFSVSSFAGWGFGDRWDHHGATHVVNPIMNPHFRMVCTRAKIMDGLGLPWFTTLEM